MLTKKTTTEITDMTELLAEQQAIDLTRLVSDIATTGLILSAKKKHGKTNAFMLLAKHLVQSGQRVVIIDNAQNWLWRFPLIDYEILDDREALTKERFDLESRVYDISKCMSRQSQRFFVSRVVGLFYEVHVQKKFENKGDIRGRTTIILEEAPITLGRTLLDEVLSMSAVGRNFGLTFILTTQRLADVSAQIVERATYLLGKHIGDNDLRKIKRIIGKEWVREVPKLAPGEWLHYDGLDTRMLRLPEYKGRRRMQVKKMGFWGRWFK